MEGGAVSEERILYHLPLSAGSRAVRLALAEKGWDCALVAEPVWERRESFLVLNPAGEVPVLADGATSVCGAGPILEYLDDVQPDSPLIAGGPAQRAECRRLCDWFARAFHGEVVHPLLDEKVLKRFFRRGQPDSETIRLAKTALTAHLDYIAWLVERRRWLAGDVLSRADLVAAAELSVADYLGDVAWSANEAVRDWYAKLKSRPAFRALLEDYVPGVSPPRHYADLDF